MRDFQNERADEQFVEVRSRRDSTSPSRAPGPVALCALLSASGAALWRCVPSSVPPVRPCGAACPQLH
eukprot:6086289-Prymnesium_polylepis.1